jgi:hypothetical protein
MRRFSLHYISLSITVPDGFVMCLSFAVWAANLPFATEARKHGNTLKDLKQKALVGFGALEL